MGAKHQIALLAFPLLFAGLSLACSSGRGGGGGLSGQSATFSADGVNIPPSAVSKGSFTIWAEPENPEPLESYTIYTRVKLPKGPHSYDIGDLSGSLMGTDGFAIPLGGRDSAYSTLAFSPKRHSATMMTEVPGAKTSGIKDTIIIKSKLLKEEQQIELVFGAAALK